MSGSPAAHRWCNTIHHGTVLQVDVKEFVLIASGVCATRDVIFLFFIFTRWSIAVVISCHFRIARGAGDQPTILADRKTGYEGKR